VFDGWLVDSIGIGHIGRSPSWNVGTEEVIRAAIARPVARASGLRWRLWGGQDHD
jgi:hypothetical protein